MIVNYRQDLKLIKNNIHRLAISAIALWLSSFLLRWLRSLPLPSSLSIDLGIGSSLQGIGEADELGCGCEFGFELLVAVITE